MDISYKCIQSALENVFEKKRKKPPGNKIPKYIRKLMSKKSKLSKKVKNTKHVDAMNKYVKEIAEMEDVIKASLDKKRDKEEDNVINEVKDNPKKFYRYAKKYSKLNENIGPLMNENEEIVTEDESVKLLLPEK